MTPEGKSTIDLLISQPATGVWISQEICEVNWPRLSSISCHQTWSDAFCWWSLGSTGGRFRGTLRGKKTQKMMKHGSWSPFYVFFLMTHSHSQLFAQPGQVNGNHDNWVCGGPGCGDVSDNFGIGQMQWLNRSASSGVKNMVQPLWGMENPERMVLSDFWLLVSFMFFWFSPEMGWRSPWQADVDGMRSHQPWNLSRIHWTLMKLWDVRHIIVWGSEHGAWYRRYPKMFFFGGKLF